MLSPVISLSYQLSTYLSFGLIPLLLFVPYFKNVLAGLASAALYSKIVLIASMSGQLARVFLSVTQLFGTLSTIAGIGSRIAELLEAMDEQEKKMKEEMQNPRHSPLNSEYIDEPLEEGEIARLEGVQCKTPLGTILFQNLSFSIIKGQNIIVMGKSGCGKSSLLRILAGIWKSEEGRVLRPPKIGKDGVFFLPQKPLMVSGSLREQILYPSNRNDEIEWKKPELPVDDQYLLSLLEKVNLAYLVTRYGGFDSEQDWATCLSLGEQQRIAMARTLFHRPILGVFDEATSAVDPDVESKFYRACREMGITYISVCHNETCIRHHDILLQMNKDEGNSITFSTVKQKK